MWCHVIKQIGNISGKHSASIFRVEDGGIPKKCWFLSKNYKALCQWTDPHQLKLLTFLYGNGCNWVCGERPWEASQETACSSWTIKVRWHIHKSPPLVPIISQMNPVHTHPPSLQVYFNIIILPMHRTSKRKFMKTHLEVITIHGHPFQHLTYWDLLQVLHNRILYIQRFFLLH
jgi:hypothetical protein